MHILSKIVSVGQVNIREQQIGRSIISAPIEHTTNKLLSASTLSTQH